MSILPILWGFRFNLSYFRKKNIVFLAWNKVTRSGRYAGCKRAIEFPTFCAPSNAEFQEAHPTPCPPVCSVRCCLLGVPFVQRFWRAQALARRAAGRSSPRASAPDKGPSEPTGLLARDPVLGQREPRPPMRPPRTKEGAQGTLHRKDHVCCLSKTM